MLIIWVLAFILHRFQSVNEQWTPQGPVSSVDVLPSYFGTLSPGGRGSPALYTHDSLSSFAIFGGVSDEGVYNDLWTYDFGGFEWSWVNISGVNTQGPNHETENVVADLYPGGRHSPASWIRPDNLKKYVFGGVGCTNTTCSLFPLQDLWEYDSSWSHISGGVAGNESGVYSVVPYPGARSSSISVSLNATDHLLYGGFGFDEFGSLGCLGDMWHLSLPSVWSFVGGSNVADSHVEGVTPSARFGATGWVIGSRSQMFIFGGENCSDGTQTLLNDMWKFDFVTRTFSPLSNFVSTQSSSDVLGIYSPSGFEVIGSRRDSVGFFVDSENFLLFGGYGYGSGLAEGYLQDTWLYSVKFDVWVPVVPLDLVGQETVVGSNVVGGRCGIVGYRMNSTFAFIFGGFGKSNHSSIGFLQDVWMLESEYYSCWGVPSEMSSVTCSGFGDCWGQDSCNCTNSSWDGPACNLTICNGSISSIDVVCGGRGACEIGNVCTCLVDDDLYGGDFCETPICSGELAGTAQACSGDPWQCVAPGVCDCPQDSYSPDCSEFLCFGVGASNLSVVCGGHGICSSIDVCDCTPDSGWFGRNCDEEIGSTLAFDRKKKTLTMHFSIPSDAAWLDNFGFTLESIHLFDCPDTFEDSSVFGTQPQCGFSADFESLVVTLGDKETVRTDDVVNVLPISDNTDPLPCTVAYPHSSFYILIYHQYYIIIILIVVALCCAYYCALIITCCCCCCGGDPATVETALERRSARGRINRLSVRVDHYANLNPATPSPGDLELVDINKNLFQVDVAEVEVGFLLGQKEAGTSKFATVYKSTYRGKTVAYKVIKDKTMFHPKNFPFLEKELSLVTALNHPNLVQLCGCSINKPICQVGIIMEYLENGNLRDYLTNRKKGQMEFNAKVDILKGVCSGMQYLHELEIIHRRLRPQNVFLDGELAPKINFDFGIDFLLRRLQAKAKQIEFVDEGYYVAPEITNGEEVGLPVDVFSVGMLLFEVLTENFTPFGDDDERDFNLEQRIATDPSYRPEIDEAHYEDRWFVDLIRRCWTHAPDRRPKFSEIRQVLVRKY